MNIKVAITIRSIDLDKALLQELEQMIFQNHRVTDEKLDRIRNNQPVFLVAYDRKRPVGFKLGYVIPDTSTFFSWLGGVHPDYRRQGIAQKLLERQELLAREMGMNKIYFTSYDRFPAMIKLGKKNGYKLVKSEIDEEEMKYWYEKDLADF